MNADYVWRVIPFFQDWWPAMTTWIKWAVSMTFSRNSLALLKKSCPFLFYIPRPPFIVRYVHLERKGFLML